VEVVIVVPTTLLGLLLPSDLAASSWPTKNLSLLSAADDYLLVVPSLATTGPAEEVGPGDADRRRRIGRPTVSVEKEVRPAGAAG